jgi:hypothetical protein
MLTNLVDIKEKPLFHHNHPIFIQSVMNDYLPVFLVSVPGR